MATNRQDTLDPALLRPGRLDRKIEFPLPSRRERRLIFHTVTSKMNLSPDVDLEDCERRALICSLFTDALVIHQTFHDQTVYLPPKFLQSFKLPVYRVFYQAFFPLSPTESKFSCSQKSPCYDPSHRLRGKSVTFFPVRAT